MISTNKLKVLALSVLSVLSAQVFALDENTQQNNKNDQNNYLGNSNYPNPNGYGYVPGPVNNVNSNNTLNGNWSLQNNQNNMANQMPYNQDPKIQGMPAWSQTNYYTNVNRDLMPFGSSLFKGHFANTYSDNLNPGYLIAPGDRIVIRIWGAKQYNDVLAVDQQGNIFVPEIGPIRVQGVENSKLLSTVKSNIASVFTDNIEVYVNLQSSQPIGVFVTGFVPNPGQYAGGSYDSILSFIDRAGGIDYNRGSFRSIVVKRNNKVIKNYDLYNFVLNGNRPDLRLRDGDVILVQEKKHEVKVLGDVKQEALYELTDSQEGSALINMASPSPSVTHVSVSGVRDNIPQHYYLTLDEFSSFILQDEDVVDFVADRKGQSIIAKVSGSIVGASRFPIGKTVTLRDLLSYVEVDPSLADTSSVYIKRRSVAQQQKAAIDDALRRLEQSALTATSSSVDEAKIRVQEASLIQDFVKRAGLIEPDGIVVVSRGGIISNIRLEDGDEIVVPQQSDVVLITGEVMMPKAVTYDKSMSLDDYLASAGGVSNRADDKNILVAKVNGEVGLADDLGIAPGDRVLVMPRFDSKNMQLAKDIMQIMYQLAVATKVIVDL